MGESVSESPNSTVDSFRRKPVIGFQPLRVWPAWVLIAAMLLLRFGLKLIPDPGNIVFITQALGPLICAGLLILWWLCFSRARWFERVAGLVGIAAVMFLANAMLHQSMEGIGMMFLGIPVGVAAFAIGEVLFRDTLSFKRTVIAILFALVGSGFSVLLRTEGMWSDAKIAFYWRWTPSPEELLVEKKASQPKPEITISAESVQSLAEPEWAGFRGADRTGRQRGLTFLGTWPQPPELVWKINVGPGWSSFAVAGNLLFTQEQRGEFEAVVCYDADTGKEVWLFEVPTRFEEAIGGAGPRATPTLAMVPLTDGTNVPSLFALGANGALIRLDPVTGDKVWQQELQTIANRESPTWGFSSSPLVVGSKVIVHAGGPDDKGTLAFDVETGDLAWSAQSGDHSYSSPQLCNILGEDLVAMVSNHGLELLDPNDGGVRLDYEWKFSGYRSLQPLIYDNTVILPSGLGAGTRRIKLTKSDDATDWEIQELWTTMNLKPDFNDFVAYRGHLYGFDNSIFTAIDVKNGERVWKGGRYGKGQVLLLENSGLLLVSTERGEVVMLKADPSGHTVLDRFQAIDGKTWNHPVVVGDRLYIRNGKEAACYRLPTQDTSVAAQAAQESDD